MTRESERHDPAVLVVDDDESFRAIVAINLEEEGFRVVQAADGRRAMERLRAGDVDLVLTDLRMPGMDGFDVLRRIRYEKPEIPVIVITAFGTIESAVEAMRLGAENYLTKPFDRREFKAVIRQTLKARAGSRVVDLVYESEEMGAVVRTAERLSGSDATVLICGESGTGKEMVARLIHDSSRRRARPLVTVNCAAIPRDLMESELFGHTKGSFTGAVSDRPGRFREADGGTILLDEVGELDLGLQAKLLRVLDTRQVDVLGEDRPVTVDVRVLAATNRDLEDAVRSSGFREDLFYRLNVIRVDVPPLRDRRTDIAPLARAFLSDLAQGAPIEMDPGLMEALMRHSWPGNVRELRNVIERAFTLRRGDGITVEDLPPYLAGRDRAQGRVDIDLPEGGVDLKKLEAEVILRALEKNGWNQSATARYLNIPRHVLIYRMEKFGIRPPGR